MAKRQAGGTAPDTMHVVIDSQGTGGLRDLRIGGKTIVAGNARPLLAAALFESGEWDGEADHAKGKVIPATCRLESCRIEDKDGRVAARSLGRLEWPGGDAIAFEMTITATADEPVIFEVAFTREGEFRDRCLRELSLSLPLALDRRKRVVQSGDRGIRFDTRAIYQFHAHVGLLEKPDSNLWQHFGVDQQSAGDYRIWRSESLSTSALDMFRGRQAPGWIGAYDRTGGAFLRYADIAARAPKSLYLHANDGGTLALFFQGPTHRAMAFDDPAAEGRIFGSSHRVELHVFEGDYLKSNVRRLIDDGPVRNDPALDAIRLWSTTPAADADKALPVVGGVPFAKGKLTDAENVRLLSEGSEIPLQTRALAFWPDGSVKWLLLVFPLESDPSLKVSRGKGEGDVLGFVVTRRNAGGMPFELRYGPDVRKGKVRSPLSVLERADGVRISTGPLSFALRKGARWLGDVDLNGQAVLDDDPGARAFVDYLRTDRYAPLTTHAQGERDDGELAIDDVRLEESGPLRAVVRLEGRTSSLEPAKVILRIEACAGRASVRLFHSVEFMHKDPRLAHVRRIGLRLPLAIDKATRLSVGGQDGPVAIEGDGLFGIDQPSHLRYEAWHRGKGLRHRTVAHSGCRCRGWLAVSGKRLGVSAVIRNMWQEAPNALTFDPGDRSLTVWLWPESAPLMDVRRYSNFTHSSQGESHPAWTPFWVDDFYYRYEPFVGVSKTHEILLSFHDGSTRPEAVDPLAADFQRPPLVYAGWETYRHADVLLPTITPGDERYPHSDLNLATCARWILFHQWYWNWFGKFDHGDVIHMFKQGYGKRVPAERLKELMRLTPEERLNAPLEELNWQQDYWPPHDWAFDNGRWGWSNTEGLCNLFMQTEYLRTGDRDLYFFVEAMARHVRDVDMRHAGRFLGRGTRHGVQHWSDGDHEERQTTHTEFRYHYYLSGDARSADFAEHLSRDVYLKGMCEGSANHSGRLYALLVRWEMTGDPAIGETLRRYVHALADADGLGISQAVAFPAGTRSAERKGLNDATMFFQYFGGMHALLEYFELTRDERLRNAIVRFTQEARGDLIDDRNGERPPLLALAFSARYADDLEPYRRALAERLRRDRQIVCQQVPLDEAHWTGLSAPAIHFPIALFWMNAQGYVATSLPKDVEIAPEEHREMALAARWTGGTQEPCERESWQTEYDDPALVAYLTPARKLEP